MIIENRIRKSILQIKRITNRIIFLQAFVSFFISIYDLKWDILVKRLIKQPGYLPRVHLKQINLPRKRNIKRKYLAIKSIRKKNYKKSDKK